MHVVYFGPYSSVTSINKDYIPEYQVSAIDRGKCLRELLHNNSKSQVYVREYRKVGSRNIRVSNKKLPQY
jgi:hypothetical protein